jgi:hypothetical protein
MKTALSKTSGLTAPGGRGSINRPDAPHGYAI